MNTNQTTNAPPADGGSAWFEFDGNPPPPPDPMVFAKFEIMFEDYHTILLEWETNATIQYDYKIERNENGGEWHELAKQEGSAQGSYQDKEVGACVIYHYRITAMQGEETVCRSPEKLCEVPFPIQAREQQPQKYKFKLDNPPTNQATLEWMEFYTEGYIDSPSLEDFRRAGTKRSWAIAAGDSNSPEYTADLPGGMGCYILVGIPKISLMLEQGWANLKYVNCPESSTPVPCSFAVNDCGLPKAKYQLTVSGSANLVVRGGGRNLSSTVTFTREELLNRYTEFEVYASAKAQDGDSVTIELQTLAPDETETFLGADSHTFVFSGVKDSYTLSAPVDEASGAKYRKIGLNGRPVGDEKPQAAAEADQQREETFVDALTLGLRHSVSDARLAVSGSELALGARRSTSSEVWSQRFGLRPHERPDLPFGVGWQSNLAAHVKIARSSDDADYAYVTDENGAQYRFVIWGEKFFPFPTAKHEQNTYLTELKFSGSQLIFTRKFGSTLEYESAGLQYHMSHDRSLGSKEYDDITYYRLVKITDRLGQVVNWIYAAEGQQLVPMRIEAAGRDNQRLYIKINERGLVTDIWDANWNRTKYEYARDAARNVWLLSKVTVADGGERRYRYDFLDEPDQSPQLQGPNTWQHCDVASITDANGGEYQFVYQLDHDGVNASGESLGKYNYYWSSQTGGLYYLATGGARLVKQVTQPSGVTACFENHSLTKLLGGNEEEASLSASSIRQTRVRDASGCWRTYKWGNSSLHAVRTLSNYYHSKSITTPKIIYYRRMDITHEGYGTERYEFDVDAGLNLKRAEDLSGNVTEFEYGDVWTLGGAADYHTIIPLSAGINGRYDDPTRQRRWHAEQQRWVEKIFTYDEHRVMSSVTDELDRRTVYELDALGRRLAESISAADGQAPLLVTRFEYSAVFPGVVVKKTVQKQPADTQQNWVSDLVTEYVLDSAGRVAQEITNPGGLALTVSREYDKQGNPIGETDPNGNRTEYAYDRCNRPLSVSYADGSQKTFAYDGNGNKLAETDENGRVTRFSYDALNRVIRQTRVMAADAQQNLMTQFTYNVVGSKISQTDPNGNVTRFAYDGLQRLVKTNDALGRASTFEYGANSGGDVFNVSNFKPTRSVDPRGYATEVEYDSLYRAVKTRAQYTLGASASSRQNPSRQDASAPSEYAETVNTYDDVGNLISTTDPLGRVTTTIYDALNRPLTVTNPDGTTVSAAYTGTGLKWRVTDELGRQTDTHYDAAARPVKVFAPALADGQRALTQTGYDAAGNVTLTVNPLGQAWTFAYDSRNRKISEQQPAVLEAADGQTKHPLLLTAYDAVGNVTAATDANGHTTNHEYDAANRLIKTYAPPVPHPLTLSPKRPLAVTAYDKNSNVLSVSDPNNNRITNTYDKLNRLISTVDAERSETSYLYDEVGNRLRVQLSGLGNSGSQNTYFTYDGLNRQLTETDALGNLTEFEYDAVNKIRRVDGKGQITEYTYDQRNRPLTVSYLGRSQDNRTYTYDAAGNITWVSDSTTVAYVYDALNRVVQETSSGLTHNYEYDLAGNRTKTIYGGTNKNLLSTYDAFNRLLTISETGRMTQYGYDLNGNIKTLTLPNGDVTTNTYDALNRVTDKLTVSGSGVKHSGYAQTYDLAGNVVRIEETFAASADDRIIKNLYDKSYRLVGEECYHGADRQRATYYVYDYAGNRLRKEVLTSSAPESSVTRYTYNQLNQLLTVSGADEAEFGYDANGNRRYRTALANPPIEEEADFLVTESGDNLITENGQNIIVEKAREEESFLLTESGDFLVTEDGQNLLVQSAAAEDDDDVINLITESGDALITESGDNLIVERKRKPDPPLPLNLEDLYEYDYENRLVKLTQTLSNCAQQEYRYGYDYRTRRVFRNEGAGAETISFSGGTSVSEWGSVGSSPIVEYIRGSDYGGGIGGILYTFRNNVPSFTHYDARGDVTQKVDTAGQVTYQAQYEAFGTRTKETGQTQDRQKANTKDEDPTGLKCEGHRYYCLKTCTFITRDPLSFVDGPNLYTYVRQNPWSKFDPQGLAIEVANAKVNYAFAKQVENALTILRRTEGTKQMLSELDKKGFTITIKENYNRGEGSQFAPKKFGKGIGDNGVVGDIGWDPQKSNTNDMSEQANINLLTGELTGGIGEADRRFTIKAEGLSQRDIIDFNALAFLAHELQHAYDEMFDALTGAVKPIIVSDREKYASPAEERAVQRENELRDAYGLTLRKTYNTNQYGSTIVKNYDKHPENSPIETAPNYIPPKKDD